MSGILLSLGSNLGDRAAHLENVIGLLEKEGVKTLQQSSVYESEPWGKNDQPWFLNQVIEVETEFKPEELLRVCLEVEKKLGRVREEKWGERIIDIDILFYQDQVIEEADLTIPHPEVQNRSFVLVPLVECWTNMIHPKLGIRLNEIKTKDSLEVKRI